MLADESFDAALADAVALGQLPLRRARGKGRDQPFRVGLRKPVTDPPPAGRLSGMHAEGRFADLGMRLLQLPHRADQSVCKVPRAG